MKTDESARVTSRPVRDRETASRGDAKQVTSMGCCFTKEAIAEGDLGDREPSIGTKRDIAAAAAERRNQDFKQGGGGNTAKTKSIAIRREKDELVGKIEALYGSLGEDAPIGLASCDLDQLKAHLAKLKLKKDAKRKV
ncbi:hypothetical protein, variant [Saprolegnia diclina VS20]|uniref:Uncharacterized protein n=1 Tax=Saprolegnia diclina (strain VS20) TaxID=1156394 RepID=T0QF77_SAPDV|nr:hypothetical protein, variant [Saprolegnia diclina VS20]EQC32250.1 hypothetical protein, variant [Saprolegnia diclina VS20]|eukprot:XP_008614191.1 hypothetical protein, variant [Saprolegnia diclina VS20]